MRHIVFKLALSVAALFVITPVAMPDVAFAGSRSVRPLITHVAMVTTRDGWGASAVAVFKTANAGKTWNRLLSSRSSGSSLHPLIFASIGSRTAWVVQNRSGILVTRRTNNGGHSWTSWSQHFRNSKMVGLPSDLVFADARHGWFIMTGSPGAGSVGYALFRTADGGRFWKEIAYGSHCDGPMQLSFWSPRDGALTGQCPAAPQSSGLEETSNGGVTWRQASIPTPQANPTVYDPGVVWRMERNILLLPVTIRSPSEFVLYRSIDGGLSFKPTTPVRVPACSASTSAMGGGCKFWSESAFFAFGAFDNLASWFLVGRSLYRTSDGGIKWFRMTRHAPFTTNYLGSTTPEIDFVNKRDGFMAGSAGLFATTNGGRTWVQRSAS